MKNLLPLALILLSVTACNNKSAVSTSSIEDNGLATYNAIVIPTGTETGLKCVLATELERREVLVQGLKNGSSSITVHDLNGMDEENRDLYLESFSLLGRTVPGIQFEKALKIKEKEDMIEGETTETVRILINDEYEDHTNPDKVEPGMVITGIKYLFRFPMNQDKVGDISRAYIYERSRGVFKGKQGKWKVIADLADCYAVYAQPKSPMTKRPAR